MKRFEVGHDYCSLDSKIEPIKVIKRTEKFIFVRNSCCGEWRMKIREGEGKNGCQFEFVVDSSVGRKWSEMFTYMATLESTR